MFKPLLRTIPSLSGNMKIVCFLDDFNDLGNHTFETNVRSARLSAISSQLYTKYINLSLLKSSYSWDVSKFYSNYSEYFYKTMFDVDKIDLPIYNEYGINNIRNTDYEYGVKRVSWQKNGKQFAFFAPIFIESVDDLPDCFEINIGLTNLNYKTTRTIRVNIGNENEANFLGSYIKDHARQIDSNVVYLDKNSYEGVYYGIDVVEGGLTKKHDHRLQSLFLKQNSILNFDNLIAKGFERNNLIMKQIIPFSFYFSVNDILSDVEKTMFYDAELSISGKWLKDGKEVFLNDFDFNYVKLAPQIPVLNYETGSLDLRIPGNYNIMNIGYPSLKEASFYKYRFSNKTTPNFCRWRLKYSSNEEPYITNASGAFSLYQGSTTKYGQFPTLYENIMGVVSKKPFRLNLVLPLNGGESKYTTSTLEKYEKIRTNFGCEWFEPFIDIEDAFSRCKDVEDNKVYFNGVLYDFSNIYNSIADDVKIDKFGVFARPKFHFITDDMIRNGDIVYSDYTIFKENSKYLKNKTGNCHVNDNVLSKDNPRLFSNLSTKTKRDLIEENCIFVKNVEDDGDFISLYDYGVDYYDSNSFVRMEDLKPLLEEDLFSDMYSKATNGFEILPIHRLSNLLDKTNTLSSYYSYTTTLYVDDGGCSANKLAIEEDLVFNNIASKFTLNDKSFYRKGTFIDKEVAKSSIRESYIYKVADKFPSISATKAAEYIKTYSDSAIKRSIDLASTYTFNPVMVDNYGKVYASNVFKSNYSLSPKFYGDDIEYADSMTYSYMLDNDFIYVDPYNLNHIISHYNTTWLKDDEPLSYYCLPTFEDDDIVFNENTKLDIGYEWKYYENISESDLEYEKKTLLTEIIVFIAENFGEVMPVRLGENFWMAFVYKSRFPEKNKNGVIGVVMQEVEGHTTKDDLLNNYNDPENIVELYGKEYNAYLLGTITRLLNETLQTGYLDKDKIISTDNEEPLNININILQTISTFYIIEYMFATLGLHKNMFKSTSDFIMIDYLNSKTFKAKFLNKQHVIYYLKELYLQNPSSTLEDNGWNSSLSNVFIRKRVLDDNLCMKDLYIPVIDLLATTGYSDDQLVELFLESLQYDETSGLFYFYDLIEKNGKILKIGSDEPIVSNIFIENINDLYDENGVFDSSRLRFELCFEKKMIKVDDNIWRLINLEEKYKAPYKDLYVYELEREYEYNQNLHISYNMPSEGSNVRVFESIPGCVKPMFNFVNIETKSSSKIYSEYSLNNITRSHIEDSLIYDRFNQQHTYDKTRHFYRHNCNNKVCMYDLSTMDKNTPIDICGKKYVFKSHFPENTSYMYFHDTFDLFKNNEVEFSNYAYSYSYNVFVGSITKTEDKLIEIKGSYNVNSFESAYPEIATYFKNGEDSYPYGEHIYDSDPAYSVTMSYIPTSKPIFKMTYYSYVPVEYVEECFADKWCYQYYDDKHLYDKFNLTTYDYDGITYGLYLIDVNVNNTTNAINVVSEDGDRLKYVSYINSIKLGKDTDLKYLYRQLAPFVKNNPLRYFMNNCSTIVKPSLVNIPLDYHPVEVNNDGATYYDIIYNKEKFGNLVLERYFDSISPIIREQSSICSYSMKYKDVKKAFKPSYLTNETIFNDDISICQYPGVRVYDMDDYSKYSIKKDIEYKHFNDNRMINLKESMKYVYEEYMTLDELNVAKSSIKVFEVFKTLMLGHHLSILDDKTIEWAFTKYSTSFGCQSVSLDPTQTEKLYKLEIFFELF